MKTKEITIRFNLEEEIDKRVYYAIKSLPAYFSETNDSKALIHFISTIISSLAECERRSKKCETLLKAVNGRQTSH